MIIIDYIIDYMRDIEYKLCYILNYIYSLFNKNVKIKYTIIIIFFLK